MKATPIFILGVLVLLLSDGMSVDIFRMPGR